MKKITLAILILLLSFNASYAGKYSKLLGDADPEIRYKGATDYYAKGDYKHAIGLFETITRTYKGTDKSEDLLFMLANSYFHRKDYASASHYYKSYLKTYLTGQYYEDCSFMLANCYYKQSPDPKLDQQPTMAAIEHMNTYLTLYPAGKHLVESNTILAEMYDKLAKRELLSARLYFNLGDYKGNNLRAAIVTANNAIVDYPDSKYREELAFIIVHSKYEEAMNSIKEKVAPRSQDAWDECYYYLQEYPNSKKEKEVKRLAKHLEKFFKSEQ